MKKHHIKTIRWGIIGLGHIAHKFSQDLETCEHATLYAVASRSQEKVNSFAKKYQVPNAYNSYELLVKNPAIDAVYIATPHSFHREHSILCLQHQKAVLCEKPFAMNVAEVQEMIEVAKENNTLLMEALWTYFLPHYQYVLMQLKNHVFGKVLKLEADFGFQPPYDVKSRVVNKKVGGGSLLDIGIYPVFAALSMLGIPKNIDANATFFENGADASCDITFHYGDATAYLRSTFLEETPTEAIVTCEKGVIRVNTRFHQPTTVTLIENNKEQTLDFSSDRFGYNFEIEHFNQLLRDHKKQSDIMTFAFSKNLIEILDHIRQRINLIY